MVDGGDHGAPEHRLRGYAVGGAVVLAAVAATAALLASGDGGGDAPRAGEDKRAAADVLPDGGAFATPKIVASVRRAAREAGCEYRTYPVASRDHVSKLHAKLRRSSRPPTSGKHFYIPAPDGAYEVSPPVNALVHTLEHSRVIVWFDRDLPRKARASLKAFYDHDSTQLVLVPDTTGMTYAVAATAWNREPRPNGTGRLLGCREYGDALFTALETFKDQNRGRGPERIP
jgi:hypothetical protein